MTWIDVTCIVFGLVGWAYAVKCYHELYKWARQCQRARIAVAYKQKVRLQAPLVEWLGWCNQLDADKDSNGRVVYRQNNTSVAIVKAQKPVGRTRRAILAARHRRNTPPAQPGKWSAQDQTQHAKVS